MGSAFERRIVVVTGASTSVGRAIVHAFAARGAHVGLIGSPRHADSLEVAKAEVEEMGGRALALTLDVTDPAALDVAADAVERVLGPIDVWVNHGMASVLAPAVETTPAEFKWVIDVMYLGYVHGTLAALERMRPRDRGKVIQIGSALAYRSAPLQSAQCAAQHAVRGFTDSLRVELRHQRSKVRVTEVQLPVADLPALSSRRTKVRSARVSPAFVADAVIFATEHDRREVWVSWPATRREPSRLTETGPDATLAVRSRERDPIAARLSLGRHGYVLVGLGAAVATAALAWRGLTRR